MMNPPDRAQHWGARMPLHFNSLLAEIGVLPSDVRLLRHQDSRSEKGRTPYELWRDERPSFETYQSGHSLRNRAKLNAPYWAAFVVNRAGETQLAGLYAVRYLGVNESSRAWPHAPGGDPPGTCDLYELALDQRLNDLAGRLFIEWGEGGRAWIQRADKKNKPIVALREAFREPDFPGFTRFIEPLSQIERLPATWAAALSASRGVYLLTCPRSKEQYVGSATGSGGFHARWLSYVRDGHGGNVGLRSRDPSDYQVSILEVAASSSSSDEIVEMEALWKRKLQSREMGLNRN